MLFLCALSSSSQFIFEYVLESVDNRLARAFSASTAACFSKSISILPRVDVREGWSGGRREMMPIRPSRLR